MKTYVAGMRNSQSCILCRCQMCDHSAFSRNPCWLIKVHLPEAESLRNPSLCARAIAESEPVTNDSILLRAAMCNSADEHKRGKRSNSERSGQNHRASGVRSLVNEIEPNFHFPFSRTYTSVTTNGLLTSLPPTTASRRILFSTMAVLPMNRTEDSKISACL